MLKGLEVIYLFLEMLTLKDRLIFNSHFDIISQIYSLKGLDLLRSKLYRMRMYIIHIDVTKSCHRLILLLFNVLSLLKLIFCDLNLQFVATAPCSCCDLASFLLISYGRPTTINLKVFNLNTVKMTSGALIVVLIYLQVVLTLHTASNKHISLLLSFVINQTTSFASRTHWVIL